MFYVFTSISQYYICVDTPKCSFTIRYWNDIVAIGSWYMPSYPVDIDDIDVKLSWNYRYRQLSYMFQTLSISMISSWNCRGTVDIDCLLYQLQYRRETVLKQSMLTTVFHGPNPCRYRWYRRETVVELSISTNYFCLIIFAGFS